MESMGMIEKVSNDDFTEKENLNNNDEHLDEFMQSVFVEGQSTESVDLKTLEKQDSLNMEQTKLTDLSSLHEEKLAVNDSVKKDINNSNEEFFSEETVEEEKDKGKKRKR
ncbi:conserved domain protein [Parvimonas sp. oral taxon 393 str. F0440]|nr:conserved domain protein [Parvimonas sp. oral taxon 393 str. F0440]